MEKFGFTVNSKGFRVLPPQVRVIQGDGMDRESLRRLLQNAIDRGISVSNLAFGMGGGLLQNVNRDTCKYAMKASAVQINGEWRDVYKDPITDQGKKSKRGRQAVINVDGAYRAVPLADLHKSGMDPRCNLLRPIYRNGTLLVDENWTTIRERVDAAR